MPLTVLNVAYPLAPVSEATAGGAEHILLTLDRGLVQHGHRSLVLAAAGSRCHGLLLPVEIPSGSLDQLAKQEARRQFRLVLAHALDRHSVDIVHMHGIDFHEYLPDCGLPIVVSLHLPLNWYEGRALTSVPQNLSLVCVSHSQARTVPPGVEVSRVIPNGVDLERFHLARRKGDYVLYMGRICPEKGLHFAIDAAERAATKLLIAGTVFDYPEHREYFETMIRPRRGRNAVFIGAVGGKRKAHLLAGAKCLLVPSQARETSSLIAMEAMASGAPVVAWRSGALPEIIREGMTGFLVSSVEEMARAIGQVSDLPSVNCRREAERNFSSEPMISSYLNFYNDLATTAPAWEQQVA
ncbi:MAG TPA: glycosyltransferase [Terriglobales bacterium]|nr:glycosyltransferase [Terriglobales bacterium]